jgi:hypothetical protein
LFEVWFLLVFPARLLFVPVHSVKRKGRLKPATTARFFCDRLRLRCENPSTVLECAASSSLYDDALFHATRGHPTAAAAAQLMRRIIADHARHGRAQRVASVALVKQKAATG